MRDRWAFHLGDSEAGIKLEAEQISPLLDRSLAAEPSAAEAGKLQDSERMIAGAQEVLSGRWLIFGRTVELGQPIDWLKDPLTGQAVKKSAPSFLGFAFDRENGVDIRSIWELNRLQALVDLGRAYQITSQQEYAAAVAEIIESWSNANPCHRTVNWANALEVGLRALSLIQATSLVRGSIIAHEKDFGRKLARLFYLHGRYICSHLSRGSTAFNHLAGEGAALTVLGSCLPGLPGAKKWRSLGEKALARSVDRLILPDGGGLEGSLHYLSLVCRLIILACRLTGDCGFLDRNNRWERLRAAYLFCCAVTDGGRSISEFGDSDDATVAGPPPAEAELRYRSTLNQLYLFLRNNSLQDQPLCHHFEPDLDSLWLFGHDELRAADSSRKAPVHLLLERFGYSGRYVVRWPGKGGNPAGFLRFECGPWGAGKTWAHAHADRLSFSLFLDGRPFFIDPGTGAYLASRKRREYFRSTAAHNTAAIDGYSQGEPLGPFLWKQEVPSRLLRLEETEDKVILMGEHYGYQRQQGAVHRREILLRPGESAMELVDSFFTDRKHHITLVFNLHPRCIVEKDKATEGAMRILSGDSQNHESRNLCLDLRCDKRCRISLHRGEESPIRGWFSPGFMRWEPCWLIVCEADIDGESSLHTSMSWKNDPEASDSGYGK